MGKLAHKMLVGQHACSVAFRDGTSPAKLTHIWLYSVHTATADVLPFDILRPLPPSAHRL